MPKNPGRYRSPEEYNYEYLNEKIDVYSLGNAIWSIFTIRPLFEGKKNTEVYEIVGKGKRPHIPKQSWKDKALAMIEAMNMCFEFYPQKRASSKDLELFLRGKLEEYNVTMI